MMAWRGHVICHVISCLSFLALAMAWPARAKPFQEIGTVTKHDPFVFEGDSLQLDCNITDPSVRENSSLMYFDRTTDSYCCSGPIEDTYIRALTTRAIRLELSNMELSDQGVYTCKQKRLLDGRPRIIGHQVVTVDHRPKPVRNITCIVYNWVNMTCTWDLGVKYQNPENINVSLVWTIFGDQADCPHITPTSCTWDPENYTHGHVYKIMVETKYLFHNKVMDQVRSDIESVQTKLLIKPDPVTNLHVSEKNSTCVTLKWGHSQGEFRRDELYFITEFQSQWSAEWNSIPTLQGQFETTVCRLVPFTGYEFRMYVLPPPEYSEDDSQGYTSAVRRVSVVTDEDVPGSKPSICPGCYYCRDSKRCESATIYWKAMTPVKRHGVITRYRFELRNQTHSLGEQTRAGIDLYSTTLELPARSQMVEVRVTAGTNKGYGLLSSAIVIPRAGARPRPPRQFLVQTDTGEDKLFYLSWPVHPSMVVARSDRQSKGKEVTDTYGMTDGGSGEKLTGLTVVWCIGSRITFDCESGIQWERLPPDQVTYELDLRGQDFHGDPHMDPHKDRVVIGIVREVTRDGQTLSSGIHWTDCVYLADHKPSGPPQNVRFPMEQSPDQLFVMWNRMDCSQERAYITEYQVRYCLSNNESGCAGSIRMKNVSSLESEMILARLQPGKQYAVSVRAVSSAGYGQWSPPVLHEVAEASKESGGTRSGHLVIAVVIAVVVLIIVISIAFFFWKCRRRRKKLEVDDIEPYAQTNNPGYSDSFLPPRRLSRSSHEDIASVQSHHPLIKGNGNPPAVGISKSEAPLLSFRGADNEPFKVYDQVISMHQSLPKTSNGYVANGNLRKAGDSHSLDSKALGNIYEDKNSSEPRLEKNKGHSCKDPTAQSSTEGTDEYHRVGPTYREISSERGLPPSQTTTLPNASGLVPRTSVKHGNAIVAMPVFVEGPRPKMGTSLSSLKKIQGSSDHFSSQSLEEPSAGCLPFGDVEELASPTQCERVETPVWQLREESGDTESSRLDDTDSSYTKMCEAPTLERGRNGLFNLPEGVLGAAISDVSEKRLFPEDLPSPGNPVKLEGYFFPCGQPDSPMDVDENVFHRTSELSADGFQPPVPRKNSKGRKNAPNSAGRFPRDSGFSDSSQHSHTSSTNGHHTHSPPPAVPSGYLPHSQATTPHQPKNSPPSTATSHDHTNGHIPIESPPIDEQDYLAPLELRGRSSFPKRSRSSLPPNNAAISQQPPLISFPLCSTPIKANVSSMDVPPSYPAPPPPNILRNPRLASLAIPQNGVSRPLSGVLLNLPSHYYQEPDSTDSSRISTEL